jgi:hypothetical protein
VKEKILELSGCEMLAVSPNDSFARDNFPKVSEGLSSKDFVDKN